eukprot:TRINITY_DN7445_c0_g1_i2.p1 TRINITY_DN7445_c0_g1~~TRINITY_DN7445_c0_g1_i2.p1  ORF type:complete len:174 (-),score=19.57 TRINITY_DN7445_c0_g1_i2:805-1326(-)
MFSTPQAKRTAEERQQVVTSSMLKRNRRYIQSRRDIARTPSHLVDNSFTVQGAFIFFFLLFAISLILLTYAVSLKVCLYKLGLKSKLTMVLSTFLDFQRGRDEDLSYKIEFIASNQEMLMRSFEQIVAANLPKASLPMSSAHIPSALQSFGSEGDSMPSNCDISAENVQKVTR